MKLKHYIKPITISLWIFTAIILLYSLSLGPGNVSFVQTIQVLSHKWLGLETEQTLESLVWQIRLPRSLLALLIGAALGCGGVLSQGIFRNPLASPNILGLNSGAAVMIVLGVALGLDDLALWASPLIAAIGVLLVLLLLYLLMKRFGSITGTLPLLLSGLALSTLLGAIMTLLLSISIKDYGVSLKVMQWLLGNLEARSWMHLSWGILPIGLGLGLALYVSKDLDILHLGQDTAASLGVNLAKTYLLTIVAIALLVGASTALVGIIGFVDLVIPHTCRLLLGAKHSRILPFSISLGACALLLVDILSRTFTQIYLPPGVITSLVGAPLFLWLTLRYYQMRSTGNTI